MTPQELKTIMSSGLLSFPLTDFDAQGDFNPRGCAERAGAHGILLLPHYLTEAGQQGLIAKLGPQ